MSKYCNINHYIHFLTLNTFFIASQQIKRKGWKIEPVNKQLSQILFLYCLGYLMIKSRDVWDI